MWKNCDKNQECKTCIGSNCNSRRSFTKCIQCSGEKDALCAIDPQQTQIKVCNEYVDECFTFIDTFDVIRGCLGEQVMNFRRKKRSQDKYAICSPSDDQVCNNQVISMETCVECDSDVDERCYSDPLKYKGKICSTLYSKGAEGCYLKVVSLNLLSILEKIWFGVFF